MRACESCGVEFEPSNRRQRFCGTTCRVRAHKAQVDVSRLAVVAAIVASGIEHPVVAATRGQLEEAGRLGTPLGANALLVAERLALSMQSADSGSAFAAVSRQHAAILTEALRGAVKAGDQVDDLRTRRLARKTARKTGA